MKVLIATGGTGGHIYPGILVGKYLKENGIDVLFTIGKRKREIEIMKKEEFPFVSLPLPQPSKISFYPFLLISLIFALKVIIKFKPDKIFATGSYSSFPILFWANFLKIPYYLHEQNTIPGKVIKIFSKKAKKVFVSFEETKSYLKKENIIFSGFPVRENIGKISKDEAVKKFNIISNKKIFLLIGGSGGSKYLLELIKKFDKEIDSLNLFGIIIKGNQTFDETLSFENIIFEYIDEIEYAYAVSDFVIGRGGAGTIWECIVSKKPSLIVPIKTSKHQIKNSKIVEKLKIGEVFISEDETFFIEKLKKISENLDYYQKNFSYLNLPKTKDIILKEILYE
ncbi:MAG: UDP-N-acetylglucosamine--N-acetylmuramyl-(pentapeptide) pyrophosphoryl-undecaprenol N-acetylglucosamine transferase [Caldisericia bacterium]|jgi:UDP-N-acetylglucosamine--N-acetylmuramyl-(pentapeptide) pyrophosphoryl-undecaprenol N-acetylglucosamine transferase|nr:UDP-N-acetylglucosamine--N-acetylmuramyl-(pentapeptide) pyrophosphoryl-undecaprenol N-acetylglucosamine transferase [Caldisericia bacterium]